MRQMQALVVGAEDLRRDPHPRPDQEFVLIERVGLGHESALAGPPPVVEAEIEPVEQQVGRLVEQHHVIGQVHMAVVVDPFGQDLASEFVERCGNRRHEAHLRSVCCPGVASAGNMPATGTPGNRFPAGPLSEGHARDVGWLSARYS